MKSLKQQIELYSPFNEQEAADRQRFLNLLCVEENLFSRENQTAHITASAWIVSPDRKKVLMAYHNLYGSWAWLGGHADGNEDLKSVVLKEVEEESGLSRVRFLSDEIFSIEILAVNGHEKKRSYIPSHLHFNVTFLLEANPNDAIRIKSDENSAVDWIAVEEIENKSSEAWFVQRVYQKLCEKVGIIEEIQKTGGNYGRTISG